MLELLNCLEDLSPHDIKLHRFFLPELQICTEIDNYDGPQFVEILCNGSMVALIIIACTSKQIRLYHQLVSDVHRSDQRLKMELSLLAGVRLRNPLVNSRVRFKGS